MPMFTAALSVTANGKTTTTKSYRRKDGYTKHTYCVLNAMPALSLDVPSFLRHATGLCKLADSSFL